MAISIADLCLLNIFRGLLKKKKGQKPQNVVLLCFCGFLFVWSWLVGWLVCSLFWGFFFPFIYHQVGFFLQKE